MGQYFTNLVMSTRTTAASKGNKPSLDRNRITKLIDKKESQLKDDETKIYQLSDEIKSLSRQLQHKRAHEKSVRVAEIILSTHLEKAAVDREKRPSDRQYNTREYTKMDKDSWRFEDMRSWFNKYSAEDRAEGFDPFATGYRLRI
jgi:hypothetical protein